MGTAPIRWMPRPVPALSVRVRERQCWWHPEAPAAKALVWRRVEVDLYATDPSSGLVEHGAARLSDVQHSRLGTL